MPKNLQHKIAVSIDVVLLTLAGARLQVALLRRDHEPFAGRLALPGGYVRPESDGDARATAMRVLRDKAGLDSPYLEQLFTFSGGARDPRGWSVAIAHYALVPFEVLAAAGGAIELQDVDGLPQLPFDHNRIVDAAVSRLRSKANYSSLPAHLLPATFTLAELQATYEKVIGAPLDKSAFRRKVGELGFLEQVTGTRGGKHRPAQLYRIRPEQRLALFDRVIAAR